MKYKELHTTEEKKEKKISKDIINVLKELWVSEIEVLAQIKNERADWDDYVNWLRDEIEADLILLRNQKKQKEKIWDTTLFNVHSALVARSFQSKTPIKFKWDKNWIERQIKMLNSVWNEDNQTPYMKSLRYYQYFDKFATGVSITAKVWWDWVYKRNIYQVINPLLAVPDPYWDYFTWDYRYIWFSQIKNKEQLEAEWYECEDLNTWGSPQWALEQKWNSQTSQWLANVWQDKDIYELYLHFTHIEGRKVWVLTWASESVLLNIGFIKPGNKYEEKHPEAIKFPFSFKYWKPLRDNFFWDRPANYTRDVQIQKAIIANLRLDKMRAELYPMYIYNKDYINSKDLSFWFNKWIPVTSWFAWPVNLWNLITPVQKDLRIDTSITVEQLMDRQVEKSTSIWDVVQWTTPKWRETLGTNQLIQSNTDINLALNEELDLIWEEQFVITWFSWYYQNFKDADTKLVYAWLGTSQIPLKLKRKDFIYEWNLAISLESSAETETRKRKTALAYQVTAPLILQDQSISESSKRETLRRIAEANWVDDESIDIEIPKTSQQRLQQMENELLNDWEWIDINPEDDDEAHLIEMWSMVLTPEAEMHQFAHIQASIQKWLQLNQTQNTWLLNSISNIGTAQASQEMNTLQSN